MPTKRGNRWGPVVGPTVLVVVVSAWLWPIGIGGQMPVGGDVTQFQIGLMSVLKEAIGESRLPLWNERWGFGFPGLGESQMGVYYPPHQLLYRFLDVEQAYTASLVLHLIWGGLGTRFAARRFGVSELGATMSGIAWSTSGFFLIHLPHQWSYSVGSWSPWAWGIAWASLSGTGTNRAPLWVAAILAIQLLPGHFQLAFCTQISLLIMVITSILCAPKRERGPALRRGFIILPAIASAFLLAMPQILPTAQLALLSDAQRDYGYLSGFATTPFHLISLVAPGLFHRSPLWRPLVWDPFHTSPEELLLYVGLVPLFLGIGAFCRPGSRRRPIITLGVIGLCCLGLSLGPYLPGFSLIVELPGFSFFRAPARWSLVVSLAISILGGFGLDAILSGHWQRPSSGLTWFVLGSFIWVGLVVGLIEVALTGSGQDPQTSHTQLVDRLWGWLPWEGDPTFTEVIRSAKIVREEERIRADHLRAGLGPIPPNGLRFDRDRLQIYLAELGPTVLLLLGLLVVGIASRKHRRIFIMTILALAFADLGLLTRLRPIDSGPLKPLNEQSPILGALKNLPEGERTVDPLNNLAMISGATPVIAYRTIDLPIAGIEDLLAIVQHPPTPPSRTRFTIRAAKALGVRLIVFGPIRSGARDYTDRLKLLDLPLSEIRVIEDPILSTWLFGAFPDDPEFNEPEQFVLLDLGSSNQGRLLPDPDGSLLGTLGGGKIDPSQLIQIIERGKPVQVRSDRPELRTIDLTTEGPSLLVISHLHYPEWQATLSSDQGSPNQIPLHQVLGGWEGIRIPSAGTWTLRLRYKGRAAWVGLGISGGSWALWLTILGILGRNREKTTPASSIPEHQAESRG